MTNFRNFGGGGGEERRILSIDGLKGIACIIIAFITHFKLLWPKYADLLLHTQRFVEVFVCLSGFTMAYNYKRKIQGMNFENYFFKRYFKVMPLYWLTTIAVLILVLVARNQGITDKVFIQNTPGNLLLVLYNLLGIYSWVIPSNIGGTLNGAAWTLNVLLLCYIFYYFICKKFKTVETYFISIFCILAFSLIMLDYGVNLPFFHWLTLRAYAAFAVGLLIYEIYNKITELAGKVVSIFILCAFIWGWVMKIVAGIDIFGNEDIAAVLIYCPAIILPVLYLKSVRLLMETRLLLFLGKISMSIYLWHNLFRDMIDISRFSYTYVGYIIYIMTTLLISVFSRFVLEPKLEAFVQKVRLAMIKDGV